MNESSQQFVHSAAVAGMVAFLGDFVVTTALAFFYPGYNHIKLVMSELGTVESPVAMWISLWWVIFGFLFILFAMGFRRAFGSMGGPVTIASLLILVFGLGAGIGAGLFPMDPGGTGTSLYGTLHDTCAGIGFLALQAVPALSTAIFRRRDFPRLHSVSIADFVLGLAFLVIFVISGDTTAAHGLLSYDGLWQRLFLLTHYGYLALIAVQMIRVPKQSA